MLFTGERILVPIISIGFSSKVEIMGGLGSLSNGSERLIFKEVGLTQNTFCLKIQICVSKLKLHLLQFFLLNKPGNR